MSNMNPTSYLQVLMEKANKLRTEQEIRQREMLQTFAKNNEQFLLVLLCNKEKNH